MPGRIDTRFIVNIALMDGKFQLLRGELGKMGMTLNEPRMDEHMGDTNHKGANA